jgi:Cu2+-containing amine oxidase
VGEIHYFDACLNDNDGHPQLIKNAICLHEEDHGMLWKHADWRTGQTEVRRSRRLVISMIATVGNYEYGYFWYLYQDGTIEYEVKLTGVISNGALHLWVTAYDPDQRFPAGEYPNQHPGGDGLPAWTAADRPLENADLVLWHTFTAHHVVRPEDWPVISVTRVGFQLRADGFFDGNPALDVAPAEHCH